MSFMTMLSLAVLLGRLFVFMIVPDWLRHGLTRVRWQSQLRASADLEHFDVIETDDARGRVLFRNGAPWSGSLHMTVVRNQFGEARPIAMHRETMTEYEPDALIGQVGLPDDWPANNRVVQEQGRSGLEYTFDSVLQGKRPGYTGILKDIHGLSQPTFYQIQPLAGEDVRTTIDDAWQGFGERSLKRYGVKQGAFVLVDIASRQAICLASRDVTNPRNVVAVKAFTPGSIFKLITAAAGLESLRFRPVSTFFCPGSLRVPGVSMNCWTRHGSETLMNAIADSCDVSLAEVGISVGRVGLEEMARRLRIETTQIQSLGHRPILHEAESGAVFKRKGDDIGLLANTAIGQEDVRLSPLQVANLAATIGAGGIYRPVRLILDTEQHGTVLRDVASRAPSRVLSSFASSELANAMVDSTQRPSGTAYDLHNLPMSVAVKTGTAELGNTGRVNGWMAGFFPADHPRFAFCVFVGGVTSEYAHRVVYGMTKDMFQAYQRFLPDPSMVNHIP